MTWLLNSDRDIWLQGWIPQRVIDKALSGAQFDYIRHMRARAEELTRARAGILDASIGSCEDIVINSEGWEGEDLKRVMVVKWIGEKSVWSVEIVMTRNLLCILCMFYCVTKQREGWKIYKRT